MPRRRFLHAAAICLGLLVHAAGLVAADEFPPELVRFTAYAKNPVFTAAGPGHWDAKIRERGWILREGETWRLWYTGDDGTPEGTRLLGYATSPDGLTWTRHAANPLDRNEWIEDMQVVKNGDAYLMVAEGMGDQAQWLTSRDGLTWHREGTLDVRMVDGTRIEAGPYGTPTVWFEEGVWHLFYERRDAGVWLARSRDLKVWTNVQDEPVLPLGPEPYDRLMIALNQIIKYEGRYYAYYHGSGTPEKPRLWSTSIAVSSDLVHWKKYAGNPLTLESANQSSGIVIFDGKQYRLYTMHDKVEVHFAKP
ncbi:MAG: glycosylase [Planctomycetaceae bacterium]|nr:glycosylase [Planctomycetaceae bacterium]